MGYAQGGDVGVLDFVLKSGGRGKRAGKVTGLGVDAGAIVFALAARRREIAKLRSGHSRGIGLRATSKGVGGKKTLDGIRGEQAMVRLRAADLMVPVGAAGEVPAGVGGEIVQIVDLVQAGRGDQGLAGNARFAG